MARPYRILGENAFYHITSRGDGRRKIFKNKRDKDKFLGYVTRSKGKYNFRLYAYVLMDNHYHLLIETLKPNLSKIMHYINSVYTTYFNKVNNNVGHVFQGRYKSIIVDADNYYKKLTRYIHLNPVKAKIVEKPEDYKWSSYREYIKISNNVYIDREEAIQLLGMGVGEYKRFVEEGSDKEDKIFDKVYANSILGRVEFVKEKLGDLKIQIEAKGLELKKDLKEDVEEEEIRKYICETYMINDETLRESKNKQSLAKKNYIYLLKRLTGKTNGEIGEILGMGYSAVSKAYLWVEREMKGDKHLLKEIQTQISNFKA